MVETNSIEFVEVPLDKVPSWTPVVRPSINRKKSQWDGVLRTLEQKWVAIKVVENDVDTRNRYKSTLQTQAKNWGLDVRVRTDGDSIYAWKSVEPGRFPPAAKDISTSTISSPLYCIGRTSQNILFGGEFINLSEIGRITGVKPSHLSRIFSGSRELSLTNARNISRALGMTLDGFVQALDLRIDSLKNKTPKRGK
jgi:helix-turn-helix protein